MATEVQLEYAGQIEPGRPCILGIDEAGRGPVLGPMVYAACFCAESDQKLLQQMGMQDSKVLTEERREILFQKILSSSLGFVTDVISPQDLSQKMLRVAKYNLNQISHDSTIGLIRKCLENRVNVKTIYVDTVGETTSYEKKLSNHFPGISVTVSKKADSIYPIVSAASICAKVIRDHQIKNWVFCERNVSFSRHFGSGYPSDPVTKAWLVSTIDPVFGFPSLIRFSWKTASNLLNDHNILQISWGDGGDDEIVDEEEAGSEKKKKTKKKRKFESQEDNPSNNRFAYFRERNLAIVSNFSQRKK